MLTRAQYIRAADECVDAAETLLNEQSTADDTDKTKARAAYAGAIQRQGFLLLALADRAVV